MAITSAVIALERNQEFRDYAKLNFLQTADWILSGNFPANVTTAEEKNIVTQYASNVYAGAANVNSQVLVLLAQHAIQDKINGVEGVAGAYSIMQTQARLNIKNLAGCKSVYA